MRLAREFRILFLLLAPWLAAACTGSVEIYSSGKTANDTALADPKPVVNPANVDPICENNDLNLPATSAMFLAKVPVTNPLTSSCSNGFEANDLNGTLTIPVSGSVGLAAVVPLLVDIATYVAPDHIKILAHGLWGLVVILDTCTLQTGCQGDPTGSCPLGGSVPKGGCTVAKGCRPPEMDIQTFEVDLPAGTDSITLEVDKDAPFTPNYVQVLGLCGFSPGGAQYVNNQTGAQSSPFAEATASEQFRLVAGPGHSKLCPESIRAKWPQLVQALPSPDNDALMVCPTAKATSSDEAIVSLANGP